MYLELRIKNMVQISIKSYEPELASQIADKVIYELEKTLQQNKKSKDYDKNFH